MDAAIVEATAVAAKGPSASDRPGSDATVEASKEVKSEAVIRFLW